MSTPESASGLLHCSLCKEPLSEPRFYVHVIGRSIYHMHCALDVAPSRKQITHVPTAVAKTLVQARHRWRLLECGFRFETRDAWWGLFVERCDVRLTLYVCLLPCVPLRFVIGPRLTCPSPA